MNVSTSASIFGSTRFDVLGDAKYVPPGRKRMHGDAEIGEDFAPLGIDVVEEQHEDVSTVPPARRSAVQKLTLLRPSVVMSSTSRTRWPSRMALDLGIAAKTLGLACARRALAVEPSAIQAAKGIPAVSPPATASNCSNPASCITVEAPNSISVRRTRGNEINRRQSV